MDDSGADKGMAGAGRIQAAISHAYFPYEVTLFEVPGTVEISVETKRLGALQISHMSSNASYSGRRRNDGGERKVFVLHLMERGAVEFTQHGRKIIARAGSLVLIDPDPALSTRKTLATQAIAVPIPAKMLTMYYPEARSWNLSVSNAESGSARVLREALRTCWRQRHFMQHFEAQHLGKTLIHLIGATFGRQHLSEPSGSRSMQMHFMRICEAVNQNLDRIDLGVDWIAAKLGMSRSYVFAIMKASNTTLGALILSRRLERCREMLANPSVCNVSITEVAFMNGFRELPYFSKTFSKRYGESPRSFRLRQQQAD